MRFLMFLAAVSLGLAGCATSREPITTRSLMREMTNLDEVARYPAPPFTCRQFSSYDRASVDPADAKSWFANGDAGHFLRVDEVPASGDTPARKEHVLAEMDGPGAIVRIWSANPAGTLRIYLDGSSTPALEMPMTEFLGGGWRGSPRPIAGERSRGWNSFLPIPYAKHCRVTSDQGGFYYHVNYRTYPPGTEVITWGQVGSGQFSALERVYGTPQETYLLAAALAFPETVHDAKPVRAPVERLAPGESRSWRFSGAREIVRLWTDVSAENLDLALRQTLLRIEFDGAETVCCPLGDFYGSAPGLNPYDSLPILMNEGGSMESYWRMPFRQRAVVTLTNHGGQPVEIATAIETRPHAWTERSMHFFAGWRITRQQPTRPMIDWNFLTVSGQGVFVGAAFHIANPVRQWWGEGDEKIYVDGERFPSHFGTGTEDYFGYAWCWPGLFRHAYHNQSRCDGPGNYGHTSVNRWHILDRIPFAKDFRFDMELWHWHEKCRVDMSVTAYWYARPGATHGFAPIAPEDLALTLLPKYEVPRVAGAIEGESLRIIASTAKVEPQGIEGCSGESHLWWHGGNKPGDVLTVAFEAPVAGRYRVWARCLQAGDYGVAQLRINGEACGGPRDFFAAAVTVAPEFELGVFDLRADENHLSLEITGKNERSRGFLCGLDYLRLEPAP